MKKLVLVPLILCIVANGFSFGTNTENIGVLILAHGGKNSSWDEAVNSATKTLKQNYLVEVAFGMANPASMQTAIDKLESQGATKIIVVQLFISSHSPIIRQNEYLLGLRDTLADPPLIMMHHGSESTHLTQGGDPNAMKGEDKHKPMSYMSNSKRKMELKPLNYKSEIVLTKPLDAHPFVAEIILDRITELSTNPINETVLIVAHGPNDEQDNKNWINAINSIADQIRAMQLEKGNKFKQIFGLTVRDDADPAIYDQAKEQLRNLVSQSGKEGEVIVIPLLLSQGGVEARYVKRLKGLKYKWSGKTLLPHPNITKFIQVSVENASKNN